MFYYIAIIVSIIGLIIATYTDLKERIVHNKLNFGLAGIGLIIYATQSIMQTTIEPIFYSIIGLCFGFFFGWILWKAGIFAGGDVKLFMALGALNPFTPALIHSGILSGINIPLFPITLFLYSLVGFLPYGFGVAFYKLAKNKEHQKKIINDYKKWLPQEIHLAVMAAALYVLLNALSVNYWIGIPLLLIWGFGKKYKKYATIILGIVSLILKPILMIQAFVGIALTIILLYGAIKLMLSLRPLLSKKIKVNDLEEGMIPAKSLAWKGKKVVELEGMSFSNIIKYVKEQRINEIFKEKKEIVSARKARGMTEKELKRVKELAKRGLIGKEIMVKDSMPFVPTVMIGYVLCIVLGDAIIFLLTGGFI